MCLWFLFVSLGCLFWRWSYYTTKVKTPIRSQSYVKEFFDTINFRIFYPPPYTIEYQCIMYLLGIFFSRCIKISSFCTYLPKISILQKIVAEFSLMWWNFKPNDNKITGFNQKIWLKFVYWHASLKYLSTLAVLQLDAILPNAVLKQNRPANPKTKNQKGFKRMLIMEYHCPALGLVRLTVGQKSSDDMKVQYCITAVEITH
jgi:hypothetical protein